VSSTPVLAAVHGEDDMPRVFPTVVHMLAEAARLRPDAPALTCAGTELTWGEYERCVATLAHRFTALGAGGERLALVIGNSIEVAVATFAGHAAGAQVVPINPGYTQRELGQLLADAAPRLLVHVSGPGAGPAPARGEGGNPARAAGGGPGPPPLLLEARGLAVSYGKVGALHGADLRVHEGQIVTVIGPNGAGKTTLLNALIGLHPARGEVRYQGRVISGEPVEARVARGLCLVPERRELFAGLSVADNLRLGAFVRYRRRERSVEADLAAVYERFPRLRERAAQFAGTLSGGERNMLALGRALMARPTLLLLDEPSLGLAPMIVQEMFCIISGLRATGVSILLVEQNARAALQVADYGYVLETGEIVLEGPAPRLAGDPRVVETYLGLAKRPDSGT
jgi:branched-chain amino acid transport system ATP-binding protein